MALPTLPKRLVRVFVLILLAFAGIVSLFVTSFLAMSLGNQASLALGGAGFLGRFVRDLGDILGMVTPAMAALGGAGLSSSLAGRLGEALGRLKRPTIHILHIALSVLAGMFLFLLLAVGVNWFYQFNYARSLLLDMTIAGGIVGAALSFLVKPSAAFPIGMVIYYGSRTIFNALRSIEALVMAIVFVVWVGIGPFAGSLALALHTIAALAKLYSEQVESIMAGPIEAVQATGATRLQTIVYAVLPQIIPPYISFTMYRWDINVRMSTIIGFAGGGGIGFLLQQNINLLNYRDASAQMLAIAIVVAAMDYISSRLREKFV
jgi:phosphonate ABC transporter permease subunit PhnE